MMIPSSEIRIGRYATDDYEPRQVREEAAVNNAVCVVTASNLWFQAVDTLAVGSREDARPRIALHHQVRRRGEAFQLFLS
jgi:hypothetical protein